MTTQTTTIEESTRGLWRLVGASAFTLVLLVGAALWLLWPGGDAAPSAPASSMNQGATARVTTTGGIVELYPDRDGGQAAAVQRFVYLVGSEEAAAAMRQLATEADQVHAVATEEDATEVRAGLGRSGTTIIDLRAPAAGVSGACAVTIESADCD